MRLKDLRTNACRIACEHQESRDVRIGQADCRLLLRPELQCTTAVETSCPCPCACQLETPLLNWEKLNLVKKKHTMKAEIKPY